MRKPIRPALASSIALTLLLTGCGGSDDTLTTTNSNTPIAAPVDFAGEPPGPAGVNFDVMPCLQQQVLPGRTVADLVVPDTLTVDFSQPSAFPNGRRLQDPVVDLTLAALFLDLKQEPVTRFADLPLDPPGNDLPFRPNFPFLAAAQGDHPVSGAGSNFNFRTDPPSTYVRVDRMGFPAVATVLITNSVKSAYNDANPVDDDQLKFFDVISHDLTAFTNALSVDFGNLKLHMCAVKQS
jgi:hypothetical protein